MWAHGAFAESVNHGGHRSSQEDTDESHPNGRTFDRVLGSLKITRRGLHPLSSLYPIASSMFPTPVEQSACLLLQDRTAGESYPTDWCYIKPTIAD